MAQSSRLRLQDLRAVYELIGECRDLGDDPTLWRTHFAARMAALTGSAVSLSDEGWAVRGRPSRSAGLTTWGWQENGFDRRVWGAMFAEFQRRGPAFNPHFTPYMTACEQDAGVCLSRADVLPDADWYRSEYFREYHRPCGGDAALYCVTTLPRRPETYSFLILVRPAGEPDYRPRAKSIAREAHAAATALIRGPLAGFDQPAPSELPPRARQVLRCLLEGDSDKMIATRLGMARNTVNHHTKRIARHFGVASRAELLARWIRRGWGSRFAWADAEPDGR